MSVCVILAIWLCYGCGANVLGCVVSMVGMCVSNVYITLPVHVCYMLNIVCINNLVCTNTLLICVCGLLAAMCP